MHRLEHRRVGPGRVDIPTGRQADTATYRRGQIGDDVAEQVVGDDHVEATRVGDHVDGGGVDVLVGHLDVRVAFADLVDGPQPQSPGEGQHVGFVHQCQMLATPSSPLERVGNHTPHTERGVHADFGGHLVGRADANRPAVAGVGSLGALAHHHEVDARIAGQRAGHPRIQPGRTQVDVVIQLEAQSQQQTALQDAAWHRRVTDRPEQDRVVVAQLGHHRVRQHLAGGMKAPRTQVIAGFLDARHNRVEHFDRLGGYLGPDPVTGNDREFHRRGRAHDRSTTSSL